jgi:hypothetical protein
MPFAQEWTNYVCVDICSDEGGVQEVCSFAVAYLEIYTVAVGAAVEDVYLLAVLQNGIGKNRGEKVNDSSGGPRRLLGAGEGCSEDQCGNDGAQVSRMRHALSKWADFKRGTGVEE